MTWITDTIAIGNYLEAQDVELRRQEGIASILCLDGAMDGQNAEILGVNAVEVFRLIDGPGNDRRTFRLAVEDLVRLAQQSPPVLVQCHAGRSRSVSVVAGYLMKTEGITAADALARVAAKREIAVAPALERMLDYLE
jgi:protein-tyrosine phosphatase